MRLSIFITIASCPRTSHAGQKPVVDGINRPVRRARLHLAHFADDMCELSPVRIYIHYLAKQVFRMSKYFRSIRVPPGRMGTLQLEQNFTPCKMTSHTMALKPFFAAPIIPAEIHGPRLNGIINDSKYAWPSVRSRFE